MLLLRFFSIREPFTDEFCYVTTLKILYFKPGAHIYNMSHSSGLRYAILLWKPTASCIICCHPASCRPYCPLIVHDGIQRIGWQPQILASSENNSFFLVQTNYSLRLLMLSSDMQVDPNQHASCWRSMISLIATNQDVLCWQLEDRLQRVHNLLVRKYTSQCGLM